MATNYFENLGFGQDLRESGNALAGGIAALMDRNRLAKEQAKREQAAALQFQNEQQKARAIQGAQSFYNALNAGNTDGALQIAKTYEQEINSLGDPSFTVNSVAEMAKTPQGIEQLKQMSLGMVQMAGGPEQYAKFTQSQLPQNQAQNQPASLIEYQQFQQMTPEQKAEYIRLKRGEKMTAQEQVNLEQQKSDVAVNAEQVKAERKQGVADLAAINQSRKGASAIKANMEQLAKLSEQAFDGSFSGAKVFLGRIASQIGIDVQGLPESEVFTAITNDAVLGKSQQMTGALSNADMEFLRQTAPTLQQTAAGRKKLIEYATALAQRDIDYAKKANEFRARKGYFDMGEFQDWFDAESKPLFNTEGSSATPNGSNNTTNNDVVDWGSLN